MKSNYREASRGSLFFTFYLSKDPGCPGCLMHVVKDSFEHITLFSKWIHWEFLSRSSKHLCEALMFPLLWGLSVDVLHKNVSDFKCLFTYNPVYVQQSRARGVVRVIQEQEDFFILCDWNSGNNNLMSTLEALCVRMYVDTDSIKQQVLLKARANKQC